MEKFGNFYFYVSKEADLKKICICMHIYPILKFLFR